MLPGARKSKIKELIAASKSVSVNELSSLFKVTEETIRRDLQKLENSGYLKRTYGGAYIEDESKLQNLISLAYDSQYGDDISLNAAIQATKQIKEGSCIFIDDSLVGLELAKYIDFPCLVVTNSLNVAIILSHHPIINVNLIAGKVNKGVIINDTYNILDNYCFDYCVIYTQSINEQLSIYHSDDCLMNLYQKVFRLSNKRIFIAFNEAFNNHQPIKITTLSNKDILISNHHISSNENGCSIINL